MIKCELEPVAEFGQLLDTSGKKKFGRYHGSMFWDIPSYGSKRWVVAAKIKVNEPVDFDDMEDQEIILQCMDYINTPPPRKKFERRNPNPKYGILEVYSAKIKKEDDDILISALLITETRKSKHFWGRGIVV